MPESGETPQVLQQKHKSSISNGIQRRQLDKVHSSGNLGKPESKQGSVNNSAANIQRIPISINKRNIGTPSSADPVSRDKKKLRSKKIIPKA